MELNNHRNLISNYINTLTNRNCKIDIPQRFPQFNDLLKPIDFWNLFLIHFEILNKKKFFVDDESKKLVFTIGYYFLRKANFVESPLIYKYDKCNISLDKGLVIVGGFGVGKTIIMKTIVSLIRVISVNYQSCPVRFHNTLEIVEEFENSYSNFRNDIINKYTKGFRVFDDIKNEREASNFGKVDLFKEILYKRYESKNFRTILLCNYDSEYPNDMHQAIESFDRYGDRNYDRLFETFNFIEFKGSSSRF